MRKVDLTTARRHLRRTLKKALTLFYVLSSPTSPPRHLSSCFRSFHATALFLNAVLQTPSLTDPPPPSFFRSSTGPLASNLPALLFFFFFKDYPSCLCFVDASSATAHSLVHVAKKSKVTPGVQTPPQKKSCELALSHSWTQAQQNIERENTNYF